MRKLSNTLFFLLILSLFTQSGKHFWTPQSLVLGRKIDYLSPTIYLSDVLIIANLVVIFLILIRRFYLMSDSKMQGRVSPVARRQGVEKQSADFNFGNANSKFPRHNSTETSIDRDLILLKKFFLPLVIVISIGIITAVRAQFKIPAIYEAVKLIEMVLLGMIVVYKKPKIWEILLPFSIGVVLVVSLAVAQFLAQHSIGGFWYFLGERSFSQDTAMIAQLVTSNKILLRSYATFPHPNVLGGFLTAVLPFFLFTKPKEKNLFFIRQTTIAFLLIGIVLSFSRISWLIALAAVSIFFFTRISKQKIFLWIIIVLFIFLLEEILLGRFINLRTIDYTSYSERKKLTQAALTLAEKNLFLGRGLGNFIPLLPTVSKPPFLLQPVHSVYLQLLVESGLLGLTLFLYVIFLSAVKVKDPFKKPLRLSLIIVLVLGIFDHYFVTLQQTKILLTFLIVLGFI